MMFKQIPVIRRDHYVRLLWININNIEMIEYAGQIIRIYMLGDAPPHEIEATANENDFIDFLEDDTQRVWTDFVAQRQPLKV